MRNQGSGVAIILSLLMVAAQSGCSLREEPPDCSAFYERFAESFDDYGIRIGETLPERMEFPGQPLQVRHERGLAVMWLEQETRRGVRFASTRHALYAFVDEHGRVGAVQEGGVDLIPTGPGYSAARLWIRLDAEVPESCWKSPTRPPRRFLEVGATITEFALRHPKFALKYDVALCKKLEARLGKSRCEELQDTIWPGLHSDGGGPFLAGRLDSLLGDWCLDGEKFKPRKPANIAEFVYYCCGRTLCGALQPEVDALKEQGVRVELGEDSFRWSIAAVMLSYLFTLYDLEGMTQIGFDKELCWPSIGICGVRIQCIGERRLRLEGWWHHPEVDVAGDS